MADKLHEELGPDDGIHPTPAWKVAALTDITGLTAFDVGRVAAVEREGEPGRWDFHILAQLEINESGDIPTWLPFGGGVADSLDVGPGLALLTAGTTVTLRRAPVVYSITTSGTHVLNDTKAAPEALVRVASASGTPLLELPSDAVYDWPIGTRFEVACVNANNATLAAGAGASGTFLNRDTGSATAFAGPVALYPGNVALCVKVAANAWTILGGWDRNFRFARATHSFLTIGNDANLDNERSLTLGNGLKGTDGGANSTYFVELTTTINAIGGSFALAASHAQSLFNYGGAGAATCTVQTNATAAIPQGFECEFYNNSPTGDFTITAAGGVVFTGAGGTSSVVLKYNQGARLTKITAGDTWLVQRIDSIPVNKVVSAVGSGFTLSQSANQLAVQMTNSSPATVTVDLNANQAISIGFECEIVNTAASTVSVSPAGGVTFFGSVSTAFTLTNGQGCRLRKTGVNTWHVELDAAIMASVPYITLNATALLPNERYLGTAFGHSFADGGPGNPVYAAHTLLTATQTGNYTFSASDRGGIIQYNNASTPGTFTIPSGLLPVGSEILVTQIAAAQVTIAAGAGVTLALPPGMNAKTRGVNAVVILRNWRGQDTWTANGELEPNTAFVTVGNDASLPSERALQVRPGLAMADTGGGNNITLQAREGSFVWTSGGFGFNATHEDGFIFYTGTANNTLTIPTNAANALPVGFSVRVGNFNSGRIAVSSAGVTLTWSGVYPANSSLGYGDVVRFTKSGTDSWVATWESPPPVPIGSITANLTLISAYNKWLIIADNHTADITLTIPTDAAQPTIPIGYRVEIFNGGGTSSWSVLFSAPGVTLRAVNGCSTTYISSNDKATLTKTAANTWLVESTQLP